MLKYVCGGLASASAHLPKRSSQAHIACPSFAVAIPPCDLPLSCPCTSTIGGMYTIIALASRDVIYKQRNPALALAHVYVCS